MRLIALSWNAGSGLLHKPKAPPAANSNPLLLFSCFFCSGIRTSEARDSLILSLCNVFHFNFCLRPKQSMRAGVLIAVAQTRRGRSAPLEVRKYQRGTRMTIVFPLLPLASRVGVWWALSCSSSLACLPASQPSHRRAVWTQPRATGLQGREESHVSPAPPVSVTLAAHYIKLTVATVYLRLRVAVTPKTGELCDGDAQNVYISFDLHKNVLFIRLLLGPWRRIRLSPLAKAMRKLQWNALATATTTLLIHCGY